jgi:hypothetical protein
VSWRNDLPPIPADRIKDGVIAEGARRVHRRRVLLGSGVSVAVLVIAGLAAVSLRHDGRDRTTIAAASIPTTALQGPPDTQSMPADAQGSSGVSGVVTVGGRPLAGATVTVSLGIGGCCVTRYAYTGADGRYSVTGLPAATYIVGFSAGGARNIWYNDKSNAGEADHITLADGERRSGIDGTLIAGASIAGRVTSTSGAPIAGVWVYFNGQQDYGKVETAADGTYLISDIPPGDYTMQFDPGPAHLPYIGQYYKNKPETAKADHIHLADGDHRTGVDASLVTTGG